jgi:putative salt-induced outer membrane protein YdiY
MSRNRAWCPLALALALAAPVPTPAEQAPVGEEKKWHPESSYDGKWDWVQMTSGEWLKGELIALYNDELEFESDEFDEMTLDWEKVAQVYSSQVMNVGLVGQRSATGQLYVDATGIRITGDGQTLEFPRHEVMSITAGVPKEINFWSMKIFTGLILRTGNSEVRELNFQANIKRRTIRNRIALDMIANQNTTDDEEIANNQRTNARWDKFISDRFFVIPLSAEYFRDPFQNIDARYTGGVGAGYQLMDTSEIEWQVSGGPGYQETRFASVLAGEPESEGTAALGVSTLAEWDVSDWLEFDGEYRLQLVNEASGRANHHLSLSFETEITKRLDFDVSWIWDRIEEPRPDENGVVPEKDDMRTTLGLTFEF